MTPRVVDPATLTGLCAGCQYWRERDMTCHARAPVPSMAGGIGMMTTTQAHTAVWPITAGGDGCGEWVRR
jgi:hypothetical protein